MNKILELEALRGIASLYVFFHHTLFSFHLVEKESIIGKLFSFGQEAVMVFFLLSGYVIAFSMNKNNYSFRKYFKHRFFRIYSIVIIAWIISFVSLLLIREEYSSNIFSWHITLINILMLQDISALKPGVFANPLFGNSPLWSLSYEWWFYMLFFIHYISYQKFYKEKFILFNNIAVFISCLGLITYYFYYNEVSLIAMYYYIWFSGAYVLLSVFQNSINKTTILTITGSYILIILLYIGCFIYNNSILGLGVHPILELRHYIMAYVFLIFSLFFYKLFYQYFKDVFLYKKLISIFSLLAPISFSIYVFHYPIKYYFQHFSNEYNPWLLLFVTLIITVFLAYLSEVKMYSYIRKKL